MLLSTIASKLKMALAGALVAGLGFFSAAQDAQAATTVSGFIPELGIDYHYITFAGGTLSITAPMQTGQVGNSVTIEFGLFLDNGSSIGGLTGTLVTLQNSGDFFSPSQNSFSGAVAAGNYVLAVGTNDLLETEARSGVASTPSGTRDTNPAAYDIMYGDGVTVRRVEDSTGQIDVSAVPLPASIPLLVFGLASLGYVGSRRRNASAA